MGISGGIFGRICDSARSQYTADHPASAVRVALSYFMGTGMYGLSRKFVVILVVVRDYLSGVLHPACERY